MTASARLVALPLTLALVALAAGGCADEGSTDCVALVAGRWATSGACFGMAMDVDLALDASGCAFTLSDWSMAMDVPEGGLVEGDQVTLTGSGWEDCTATAAADGASFTGSCAGSGCAFGMTAQ